MNAVVWWKEYRQQRWIWGTMLALTVLLIFGMAEALGRGAFLQGLQQDDVRSALRTSALCLALAYGVVCGALLLAGEKEEGTQPLLDRLSPRRGPVWQAKLAVGAALTLALGLVLLVLGLALGFMDWYWVVRLPLFSLDALAWGLLGGALCRKVLPAVLAATFFLAVAWVVPQVAGTWTGFLAVKAALTLVGGYLSWKVYTRDDPTRQVIATVPAAKVPTWRVLGWTMLRQGRWLVVGCLAGCVATGIFIEHAPLIACPAATWLIGIICGLAVFAPEQGGGQTFWGNQRLPAGRLWKRKVLAWGTVAAVFTLLLWVEAGLIAEFRGNVRSSSSGQDASWFDHWRGEWAYVASVGPGMFFTIWAVFGFAFGVLIGLLWRRPVLASIMALAVGGAYTLAWAPSVFGGGLAFWQVLPAPLLLLAASRWCMRAWLASRLFNARTSAGLAGVFVLVIGWLAWNLWYRVAEIPDVGPPFDVAAYRASFPEGANNEAGRLIREAASALPAHLKHVAYRLGPPVPVTAEQKKKLDEYPGEKLTYLELINDVVEHGWPKTDAQLSRYLDLVFEGEWAKKIRRAVDLPLGVVFDPRAAHYYSLIGDVQECRTMATLFVARSRQLQSRGNSREALADLRTILALSAQIQNRGIFMCFLIGRAIENIGLGPWPSWVEAAGPQPALLRSALQVLAQHEAAQPDWSQGLKSDYFLLQNTLNNPWTLSQSANPRPKTEHSLLQFLRQFPWEQEREQRITNLVFQASLAELDVPFSEAPTDGRWRPRSGPAADWTDAQWHNFLKQIPLLSFSTVSDRLRSAKATSERDLRATILLTALALYQAENSRPAARLEDLTPRYLKAIPGDPVTGKAFQYRISAGEKIGGYPLPSGQSFTLTKLAKGQGVLWSKAVDLRYQSQRTPEKHIYYYPIPVWDGSKRLPKQ